MGKTAVAMMMVIVVIGACVAVAFAAGVFDNNGGGSDEDDWREHVGEAIIYETKGRYSSIASLDITWTGTATNTLLYMSEETGYWYINYATESTFTNGLRTWTDSSSSNSWGMDENYVEKQVGEETIETKYYGSQLCNHIIITNEVTGHTEDQWIGVEDGIAYYVEATTVIGGFHKATQTVYMYYKASEKKEISIQLSVKVFADDNLTIQGEGTYTIGETVTLTASGDDFYGWFDFDVSADVPVSTDKTYSFDIVEDKVLYALSGGVIDDYTYGTEVTLSAGVELSSATWEITYYDRTLGKTGETDTVTGSAPTYVFDTPGDYRMKIEGVTVDGKEYNGYRILFVDGAVTHAWTFKYGGLTITEISLDIMFSDYVEYMDKVPVSQRQDNTKDHQKGEQFVVADDKYIASLVQQFKALQVKYGWTDVQTAECILKFTQYITYALDSTTHGVSEYWNFPVETLYLNTGDCEDTSILASAIYKGMGYDSAVILMYGHAAVGIKGTDLSGYSELSFKYSTFDRSGYYFGETTSTNYKLGEIPDGFRYVDKIVIDADKE